MDVSPQDLGPKRGAALRRLRDGGPNSLAAPVAHPLRVPGRPRLAWTLFTGACWLGFAAVLLIGFHWKALFALSAALCGALMGHAYLVFGRFLVQGPRRAFGANLTAPEIGQLKRAARTRLEMRYAELLMTLLLMPPLDDAEIEQKARSAVRALGAALDDLPPHEAGIVRDDSTELVITAAGLAVDADYETDPVIADSIRRRADALRRQAENVAWTALAVRRSAALQNELAAQIESLRAILVALSVGGPQAARDRPDLSAGLDVVAALAATRPAGDDAAPSAPKRTMPFAKP